MMLQPIERVRICGERRSVASKAIQEALTDPTVTSEKGIADAITAAYRDDQDLYDSGWYDPPPGGTNVHIAVPPTFDRGRFDSLRTEPFWSRDDIQLKDDAVLTLFSGPADRRTATIADMQFTLYTGPDKSVRDHIAAAFRAVEDIVEHVEVGMTFDDVETFAQSLLAELGTHNRVWSGTDPTGTNIGHTVPWTYRNPTSEEQRVIDSGNLAEVKELIRVSRIFVSAGSDFVIPDTIAFTIEPRVESDNPNLPNTLWHTVVAFRDGQKEVFANFQPIFEAVGMDYLTSRFG